MYEIDARPAAVVNNPGRHNAVFDSLMIWCGDRLHHRHVIAAAGFSFLLGLLLNHLMLLFIHRPGPYESGATYLVIGKALLGGMLAAALTASQVRAVYREAAPLSRFITRIL